MEVEVDIGLTKISNLMSYIIKKIEYLNYPKFNKLYLYN